MAVRAERRHDAVWRRSGSTLKVTTPQEEQRGANGILRVASPGWRYSKSGSGHSGTMIRWEGRDIPFGGESCAPHLQDGVVEVGVGAQRHHDAVGPNEKIRQGVPQEGVQPQHDGFDHQRAAHLFPDIQLEVDLRAEQCACQALESQWLSIRPGNGRGSVRGLSAA